MAPRVALELQSKHEAVNRGAVVELVRLLKRLHPTKEAHWLAAQAIGTSERWIRAIYFGEPCAVTDEQARLANIARANLLDQEIARLGEIRRALITKRGTDEGLAGGDAAEVRGGAY